MKMKRIIKNNKLIIILFSIFIFEIVLYFSSVKVAFNYSESMTPGLYLQTGKLVKKFSKNDIITFCPPRDVMDLFASRNYFGDPKVKTCYGKYPAFVKRILATAGDTIQIENDSVYLNEKLVPNSKLFDHDKNGRKLHHLSNGYSHKLINDEIFAFADGVSSSLDSRYVGLIHESDVISRAFLLFSLGR